MGLGFSHRKKKEAPAPPSRGRHEALDASAMGEALDQFAYSSPFESDTPTLDKAANAWIPAEPRGRGAPLWDPNLPFHQPPTSTPAAPPQAGPGPTPADLGGVHDIGYLPDLDSDEEDEDEVVYHGSFGRGHAEGLVHPNAGPAVSGHDYDDQPDNVYTPQAPAPVHAYDDQSDNVYTPQAPASEHDYDDQPDNVYTPQAPAPVHAHDDRSDNGPLPLLTPPEDGPEEERISYEYDDAFSSANDDDVELVPSGSPAAGPAHPLASKRSVIPATSPHAVTPNATLKGFGNESREYFKKTPEDVKARTRYLDDEEQKRITAGPASAKGAPLSMGGHRAQGKLVDARGALLDTTSAASISTGLATDKNGGRQLYTMDSDEGLLHTLDQASEQKRHNALRKQPTNGTRELDMVHHSSLSAGEEVRAAGDMVVKQGKLDTISSASGHYQTTGPQLANAVDVLRGQGVGLDTTKAEVWHAHAPPDTFPALPFADSGGNVPLMRQRGNVLDDIGAFDTSNLRSVDTPSAPDPRRALGEERITQAKLRAHPKDRRPPTRHGGEI